MHDFSSACGHLTEKRLEQKLPSIEYRITGVSKKKVHFHGEIEITFGFTNRNTSFFEENIFTNLKNSFLLTVLIISNI